jgi:hypothetical protein
MYTPSTNKVCLPGLANEVEEALGEALRLICSTHIELEPSISAAAADNSRLFLSNFARCIAGCRMLHTAQTVHQPQCHHQSVVCIMICLQEAFFSPKHAPRGWPQLQSQ